MRALLLLLLIYPFAEIAVLVALADHIGGLAVFLLVLLSSMLGLWMLRNQKLGALLTLGSVMRQGEKVSLYSLLWPLRYALAGLLFLLPGLLSDALAVLLLLPIKGPDIQIPTGGPRPTHGPDAGAGDVIEGEYSRVDDKPRPGRHLQ
ncbi:membrane protein FxsA [Chromobacterium subtsugae]|mgnify:FL=1|uniref:Membrane protein FxsA n=1 Tax=Chromobacterium subtsugae TaxID=251747 RepID=A0ABS7F8P0_9NEIS|nr:MULTISPECIES: FxsA family protein [Chromobacterium]KUM05293.1 exlusion protein FxsA [Chromobacterium subtsugae]KZE86581.1 exlusion protein FxsA [Chromobacterium sp. F49]MBW7565019.1 membrane protein FxsA [Chromobacterium subtsugae]MBW8286454.1 membrane protein FxsA [Chromobacterium subtsugae]OBU87705.1 exlusion protein FxsA [Chromobacterium subtsugae]